MAKQQVKQTGMSRVVKFEVSVGKDTDKVNLGSYETEIVFGTMDQAVDAAARTVVIRMQNNVRVAYTEGKALPYPTGKRFATDHMGAYTAPAVELARKEVDRMTPELRAAFLQALLDAAKLAGVIEAEASKTATPVGDAAEDADDELRVIYNENELRKLPRARLVQLAEKEELEGIEDLSKDDIVDELLALSN